MRLFGKKKTVHVEFFDQETGKLLGQSDVPSESLPDTFELNTTMHLGDTDWSVISAEPMTSSEFRKTGKLRLVLQKVRMMDPNEILYTLPTICNFLVDVDTERDTTGRELTIHEDDWRNIEMVSLKFDEEIKSSLSEIYRIHEEERVGQGFRQMHLRMDIEKPFGSVRFPFAELEKFEKSCVYTGLGYLKNGLITDGFAFSTVGGLTWYGRQKSNFVQELCLASCLPNEQTEREVEMLAKMMGEYHLGFVDWCQVFFASSEQQENLQAYLFQFHSDTST